VWWCLLGTDTTPLGVVDNVEVFVVELRVLAWLLYLVVALDFLFRFRRADVQNELFAFALVVLLLVAAGRVGDHLLDAASGRGHLGMRR